MRVALPARAKINLDLAVVGRRPDGLHDLRSRVQAIDLHDLLEVESAKETSLDARGFALAAETRNTVLVTHRAMEKIAGRKLPTRFSLDKRIPPGSGLGGASSDAAAAMRAMAAVYGLDANLMQVAPEIGADVTFFVRGGSALVEGMGERITQVDSQPAWFAIAWPGVELSTGAVYKAWDEVGGDGRNELLRAAMKVDGRVREFAELLGDGWQMTGSGSAFFRTCPDRASAMAAAAALTCWTAVSHSVGPWT